MVTIVTAVMMGLADLMTLININPHREEDPPAGAVSNLVMPLSDLLADAIGMISGSHPKEFLGRDL